MHSIGMVELNSIPKGIETADAMLKSADVSLVFAQPVCAGKYVAVVTGEVSAVKSAIEAGEETAEHRLVDKLTLANADSRVITAFSGCSEVSSTEAIGIIETFTLASAILSADIAVKAANVNIIEIRLGRGLGGKSFVILTGSIADCKEAMSCVEAAPDNEGLLNETVVIPSPHPDLIETLI